MSNLAVIFGFASEVSSVVVNENKTNYFAKLRTVVGGQEHYVNLSYYKEFVKDNSYCVVGALSLDGSEINMKVEYLQDLNNPSDTAYVTAVGTIGKSEVKEIGGKEVGSYSVATKLGKDTTTWFNGLIGNMNLFPYMTKGTKIQVNGNLKFNEYEGKNGKTVSLNMSTNATELLGSGSKADTSKSETSVPEEKVTAKKSPF